VGLLAREAPDRETREAVCALVQDHVFPEEVDALEHDVGRCGTISVQFARPGAETGAVTSRKLRPPEFVRM